MSCLLRKGPLSYSFFSEAQCHFLPSLSARSPVICLSERSYLRFGGARRIPIGGMKFAGSCTEFSEATVVEASVFGLGILARLPERPST
jgi:hypothetical protein